MPIHASNMLRPVNPQLQQAMLRQQQMQPQQSWGDWLKSLFTGAKEGIFGTPGGFQQLENFTPEQMSALQQLLQGGLGQLQNPTAGFEPISNETMRQFNQQVVPSLLERFTAGGGYGSNALSSPGLASQLSSAGAGLSSMLAAQKAGYGLEQQGLGLKQAALGLTPQFQNVGVPGTGGLVGGAIDLIKGVAPYAAYGYAAGAGNPIDLLRRNIFKG